MSREAAMAVATAGANHPHPSNPAPTATVPSQSQAQPQTANQGLPSTQTPPDVNAQRMALFAKKEAQLQAEREKIKAEWAEKKRVLDQAQEYNKKWEQFEALKKTNKQEALKMAGFSVEDLVNLAADENGKVKSPEEIAKEVEEKVEKKVDEKLAAREQKLTQEQNQKLINNFKGQIKAQMTKNADKYDAAIVYGAEAEGLAYHFVVENLKQNPDEPLMTVSEALEMANKYYQDKLDAAGYKKAPKVENVPHGTTTTEVKPALTSANSGRSRTLTNAVTATSQALNPGKETKEQKRERLINALREGVVYR